MQKTIQKMPFVYLSGFESIGIWAGIIGTVVGIAAYLISKKTYNNEYIQKPNEEKTHLLAQFRATQKLSYKTYDLLKLYVEENEANDSFMFDNITYDAALVKLRKSQEENLSDELYNKILMEEKLPSLTIESMSRSLEKQFDSLIQLHNDIEFKIDYMRNLKKGGINF